MGTFGALYHWCRAMLLALPMQLDTVCSCLLLILVLLICVTYLILSPFIHDKNKKNTLLGMCIVLPFLIGLIFFLQWIISFIPDIAGRPRINNLIYVSVNIIVLVLLTKKIKKHVLCRCQSLQMNNRLIFVGTSVPCHCVIIA